MGQRGILLVQLNTGTPSSSEGKKEAFVLAFVLLA
jgi:hypothetical protein